MTDQLLYEVLEATGYLVDGHPAHGVQIGNDAHVGDRTRNFRPDALWKGDSALTVYFKSEPEVPSGEQVAGWHREIWNQGFAPLLWVVSPENGRLTQANHPPGFPGRFTGRNDNGVMGNPRPVREFHAGARVIGLLLVVYWFDYNPFEL